MKRNVVAEAPHARLGVLDASQRETERRLHEAPHPKAQDRRPGEHGKVERSRLRQRADLKLPTEPVLSAGYCGPAQADPPHDEAEGEGE